MTYNFKRHKTCTTFPGLQFEVVINGVPKDLTGVILHMHIAGVLFGSHTGEFIINDPVNGRFQFKEQMITLAPGKYDYEIEFIFPNGVVKKYISGYWQIIK